MDDVGGCVNAGTKGAGPDTVASNRVMLSDGDVSHPIPCSIRSESKSIILAEQTNPPEDGQSHLVDLGLGLLPPSALLTNSLPVKTHAYKPLGPRQNSA
jgi:hypothetical protein